MQFNLADLFEAVADTVGDRDALVCTGVEPAGPTPVRWTYAELATQVDRMAHVLADHGVAVGRHVGLHLHNGWEYVTAMLAAFSLRAVPVNLNYRYVADELAHVFADADLALVLTEPDHLAVVDEARHRAGAPHQILVRGPGLDALVAAASPTPVAVGPRSSDDRYLLYTGGTTGMPKGVMWRHEDIYFASLGGRGTPSKGVPALTAPEQVIERARRGDPIMRRLPLCPMMHGGAMWVALQTHLNGGCLVLSTDRHFEASAALDLLVGERIELTMLIGDATGRPLADALAAEPDRWDLSSLQVIASGGAILAPATQAVLRRLLPGTRVIDTFGASETGGQGRLVPASENGPPRLVTDDRTAVLGDDLRPVTPGGVGRLARRGWIPLGYRNDPERTAATFPVVDGVRWSVPGDLARLEPDGTITVLGRGSQCINTGGEKVYPEEVEAAVKHHPAVLDVLVVGLPDERFGQRVTAVVSTRDGMAVPDDTELEDHARQHVAGYKVPRRWVHVDRCQRLPTGKPDYRWARSVAERPSVTHVPGADAPSCMS
jgi:acyl-CoA synthetase (AMP-forming)/AMP-acid ligase II